MKITYRITEEDYVAAYNLFIANEMPLSRRVSRMLLPWFGGALLLVQLAYWIVVPNPNPFLWGLGSLVGFYFVYCRFALRRFFVRGFRKDRRFLHDFTADISDAGVHITTVSEESDTKWAGFIRALESEKIFMLFHADWIFIIIPKRAFEPAGVEQFRELLRRNVLSSGQ
jgi:hypothetical protein